MALRLVIYVSRYSEEPASIRRDLKHIGEVSRKLNPARGITGLLFYQNRHFLQALEGESAEVEGLLATLRQDSRHREMQILVDIPISRRHFEQWDMGCLDLDNSGLFTSETLIKLRDAYSRNVEISDAAFVLLLEDILNTPGVEELLRVAS